MINRRRRLVFAVPSLVSALWPALGVAAPAATGAAAGLASRLDAAIDRAVGEQRIVGTVVLVARRGEIVHHRAAGFADRERGRQMTEGTVFRLASMTKPLVSAATLRLIERRLIGLDEPVTRWLPDFRPRLANGEVPAITIRQLLTHAAGLSYAFLDNEDSPYRRAGVSDGLDQPGLSLTENLRRIASVPLSYPPGTSWRYSLALDVLGGVLSQASGTSLPRVVEREVTGPLGMRDTAFTVADRSRLATPYADGSPRPTPMAAEAVVPLGAGSAHFAPDRLFDADSYASGGAGMSGTARDFMRFLQAIRAGGAPILGRESVAQMMALQVGMAAQTQGPGWGFGYGWAVLDDPRLAASPQSRGTIQWGGAYGHSWFFDPVADLAVVALTNTAFEGMSGAFPGQIRDAVYGVG